MQELTMMEVDDVSGGLTPLAMIACFGGGVAVGACLVVAGYYAYKALQ